MLYILLTMLSQIHEFNKKYVNTEIRDKSNRYIYIAELMIKISERN